MKSSPSHTISKAVRTGADRLLDAASGLIEGKRIGLLTNHTGRLSGGVSTIEAIAHSGICRLTALFGPEHGIEGNAPDGVAISGGIETRLGLPVFSLYGDVQKPTPEMLKEVDVLVCDIQDVGARFYTYISTIALVMEAAAELRIPVVILDRPNPIRGLSFDGPVLPSSLKSLVGRMPIPITTGLTIGELCMICNDEGWLADGRKADLHVVLMERWRRSMWYDQTGLAWIPPSPNMPTLSTAVIYPGMCLVEGTSLSEGRGTSAPFLTVGAPWADPERVLGQLARFDVRGVKFTPERFTPQEIPGTARQPKFEGRECRGIRIEIANRDALNPVYVGISVLAAFKRAHPDDTLFDMMRFDLLTGNLQVREDLELGAPPDEICAAWEGDLEDFGRTRSNYLMYD
jgi:uncharacterized protein YbbC (DUF1343 family)